MSSPNTTTLELGFLRVWCKLNALVTHKMAFDMSCSSFTRKYVKTGNHTDHCRPFQVVFNIPLATMLRQAVMHKMFYHVKLITSKPQVVKLKTRNSAK